MSIEAYLETRSIDTLFHFTCLENLENILRQGLRPRGELEAAKAEFKPTDELRLDNNKQNNCLSIEHPNYKTFFVKRTGISDRVWIVLAIKALPIICDPRTLFAPANFAKSGMQAAGGSAGLEELFKDCHHPSGKRPSTLAPQHPTNPQAEVLFPGTIPPEIIEAVYVEREEHLKPVAEVVMKAESKAPVAIQAGLFTYRRGDYV